MKIFKIVINITKNGLKEKQMISRFWKKWRYQNF